MKKKEIKVRELSYLHNSVFCVCVCVYVRKAHYVYNLKIFKK